VKRRALGLALVGAIGFSTDAMSQGAGVDPRLQDRLSGRLRDAVAAIVDSANRSNLPTEPLIKKALEGDSKGASESAIINAVSKMAQDLARARRTLGPAFSNDEVHAAMTAIKAGVDIKQLERLRAARSGLRIAMAMNVLGTVALSVDPDTAADVIIGLVLASATDEQLLALQSDVERDIAAGTPATSAMAVRGQQLTQVIASSSTNSGVTGSALPSGLGSTRGGGPAANATLGGGGAAGNTTTPAPAGKKAPPKKP
jgi:hypothetical protein